MRRCTASLHSLAEGRHYRSVLCHQSTGSNHGVRRRKVSQSVRAHHGERTHGSPHLDETVTTGRAAPGCHHRDDVLVDGDCPYAMEAACVPASVRKPMLARARRPSPGFAAHCEAVPRRALFDACGRRAQQIRRPGTVAVKLCVGDHSPSCAWRGMGRVRAAETAIVGSC